MYFFWAQSLVVDTLDWLLESKIRRSVSPDDGEGLDVDDGDDLDLLEALEVDSAVN